jgi:hypothetical protein
MNKGENLVTYLDVSVHDVQGMTVLYGIDHRPDSFCCFFFIEELLLEN